MMHRFLHLVLLILGIFVFNSAAQAAPQVLAVAATTEPINFQCNDIRCEVEISAMCLQRDRRFSDQSTVYIPSDLSSVQLLITTSGGTKTVIPADGILDIRSKRSFTAVAFTIDSERLKELGAQSISLIIGEKASLVPQVIIGDFRPQSESDIIQATGPYRNHADSWLAGNGEKAVAARALNKILNSSPTDWSQVKIDAIDTAGTRLAQSALDHCTDNASNPIRKCLNQAHDKLMHNMNRAFWNAVRAGS